MEAFCPSSITNPRLFSVIICFILQDNGESCRIKEKADKSFIFRYLNEVYDGAQTMVYGV
jgi:hypothetical protein